jgi:hypothetical protein
MLGGRLKGSHRLPGGGDRVRLSRGLERDAIDAGYVAPWQHTNAKRSTERKPYRLRRLSHRKAPRLAGQLSLFPEIERPFRDFMILVEDSCRVRWHWKLSFCGGDTVGRSASLLP